MKEEYICDDRGVIEYVRKIRNMTDEEFAEHLKKLEKEEKKKRADNDR